MTFLNPLILLALIIPLTLGVTSLVLHRRAHRGWQRLVAPAHRRELVVKMPAWRRILPPLLTLLALSCGIIAAARPINGYTSSSTISSGRNLLIALDVSRSMETQDVKPSRLAEARAAAFELIDALPEDKIGLIVFSGEADLVVPLTYDHKALRETIERVDRSWAGYGGTNFGLVLRKAMQDFARSAPKGTNALVIFSDGEDTVGSSLDIAREAKENNLLVITVGVGTSAGDSIPDANAENGLYRDRRGKHVISRMDTTALKRFSEATGGEFFAMGSGSDLASFARTAVEKLDRHEEAYSLDKVPRDIFAPFAITALILLVLAMVLAAEWRLLRRAAALLLFLLPAAPLSAAPEEESLEAYNEGLAQVGKDDARARDAFSRALMDEDRPLQAACLYQLGKLNTAAAFTKLRELYGQGSVDETEEAAEPTQPTPEQLDESVRELEACLPFFRDALELNPDMEAARSNISKIEAFIRKLKQERERLQQLQPPPEPKPDDPPPPDDEQREPDENNKQRPNPNKKNQPQSGQSQDRQDSEQDSKQKGSNNKDRQKQSRDPKDKKEESPNGKPQKDKAKDKKNDAGGENDEPKKNKDKSKENSKNKQNKPSRSDRESRPQQEGMSDEEKDKQRAAGILWMHREEENGSPIPHVSDELRPPEKDY